MSKLASAIHWLFDPKEGPKGRLIPRWLFLRALGFVYFSAFFSLIFQIRGLIGPDGILPANEFLESVRHSLGYWRGFWYAPTVLWVSSGPHMSDAICWAGMIASVMLILNFWPRTSLLICFVCFLSFVSAAQDFSGYQSDGMLLEAGFLALFFSPSGMRPGWGVESPPSRASLFLLQWEWFRIYFESGAAKILGGDPEWRNFSAMDEYYQNGPLPTWIGWYVQHLPHWFHASTVWATLALELGVVWMVFLPRRWRLVCFCIVTPWELGVILTANYTFLNYLVLVLGFLLLDDTYLQRFLPARWRAAFVQPREIRPIEPRAPVGSPIALERAGSAAREDTPVKAVNPDQGGIRRSRLVFKISLAGIVLSWIFYATTVEMIWMFSSVPFPSEPLAILEPFRIANRYGLFGIMTRGRYEIEFQGSNDGNTWVVYPFRFKPQNLKRPPGIYAPYQPRFDWNLWFASLGSWREYSIVPRTELCLLSNDADVLQLFAGNPFSQRAPRQVRAVLWQYWFTSIAEKQTQGLWWRRQYVGLYAPTLEREPDGTVHALEWPAELGPRSD